MTERELIEKAVSSYAKRDQLELDYWEAFIAVADGIKSPNRNGRVYKGVGRASVKHARAEIQKVAGVCNYRPKLPKTSETHLYLPAFNEVPKYLEETWGYNYRELGSMKNLITMTWLLWGMNYDLSKIVHNDEDFQQLITMLKMEDRQTFIKRFLVEGGNYLAPKREDFTDKPNLSNTYDTCGQPFFYGAAWQGFEELRDYMNEQTGEMPTDQQVMECAFGLLNYCDRDAKAQYIEDNFSKGSMT